MALQIKILLILLICMVLFGLGIVLYKAGVIVPVASFAGSSHEVVDFFTVVMDINYTSPTIGEVVLDVRPIYLPEQIPIIHYLREHVESRSGVLLTDFATVVRPPTGTSASHDSTSASHVAVFQRTVPASPGSGVIIV